MFDNKRIAAIEKSIKSLDTNQTQLIRLLGDLVKRFDEFLINNSKQMEGALNWAKEFNRVLRTEYAAGEQAGVVFSILYFNKNTKERRMLQTIADTLDKATSAGKIILQEKSTYFLYLL